MGAGPIGDRAASNVDDATLRSMLSADPVALDHVLDHAAGELMLAEENLADVFFFEELSFFLAVRARDDADPGVDRARDFDHATDLERVRCRDDQQARAMDVRMDQHGWLRSIAGNRRDVARAQLFDDLAIFLGDDERDALRGPCFADA